MAEAIDIRELNERIERQSAFVTNLMTGMDQVIVGQKHLIESLLIGLLSDGHILLEGVPGLAKTLAIKTLASLIDAKYSRIQFTPDLLPADVIGTMIYSQKDEQFIAKRGPIFANFVLADEINRAPAKVQAALLEAMAERQVSVGGKKYELPKLFMVMATQNPIEQEGTYNLPEAQLDRFLMYIKVDHPDSETEKKILHLIRDEVAGKKQTKHTEVSIDDVLAARNEALEIHMSEEVEEYLVQLVGATRHAERYNSSFKGYIAYGASPRATLALDRCAKVHAWLKGRDFVSPEDIHAVVYEVLRHRIILSFEAQAEGYTTDDIIASLLKLVPLP